jgi:putative membrane protein
LAEAAVVVEAGAAAEAALAEEDLQVTGKQSTSNPSNTMKFPWIDKKFSQQDLQLIADAVSKAEQGTSGEIVPVIVQRSVHLSPIILLLLMTFLFMASPLRAWYENTVYEATWSWVLLVIPFFYLSVYLSRFLWLKKLLLGSHTVEKTLLQRAELEFYRAKVNSTDLHTGILLFLSLEERKAIVLADEGIAAQLSPSIWDDVIQLILQGAKQNQLTKGFVEAILKCGELLKSYFPLEGENKNELSDRLIIRE